MQAATIPARLENRFGTLTRDFISTMHRARLNGISTNAKRDIVEQFSGTPLEIVQGRARKFEKANEPRLAASCRIAICIYHKLEAQLIAEGLMQLRSYKE